MNYEVYKTDSKQNEFPCNRLPELNKINTSQCAQRQTTTINKKNNISLVILQPLVITTVKV